MKTVYLIVTGPFSSGKSTLLWAMSGLLNSKPTYNTNSGYYPNIYEMVVTTINRATKIYRITSPGARRIDSIYKTVPVGSLGIIVIVDSAKPETFREAKSIIWTFRAYGNLPFIIAVNKQDQPDAWSAEDLRMVFRQDENDTPFVPCVATDPMSAQDVLKTWLSRMQKFNP